MSGGFLAYPDGVEVPGEADAAVLAGLGHRGPSYVVVIDAVGRPRTGADERRGRGAWGPFGKRRNAPASRSVYIRVSVAASAIAAARGVGDRSPAVYCRARAGPRYWWRRVEHETAGDGDRRAHGGPGDRGRRGFGFAV